MAVGKELMSIDLAAALEYQGGSSIKKQIFWIFILLLSITNYIKYGGARLQKSKSCILFVFIVLLAIISIYWSEYSAISAKRILLQIILIISILLSIACINSKELLLKLLYFSFSFVAVYNLVFIIIFPNYAFDAAGALKGIYKGKNYFGFIALAGLIFTVSKFDTLVLKNKNKYVFLFSIIWLVFLLASFSKTCMAIALLFIITFIVKRVGGGRNVEYKLVVVLYFFLLVLCLVLPVCSYVVQGDSSVYFKTMFDGIDLTGRGGIWLLAVDAVSEDSLLGSGYGAFWGVGEIPYDFDVRNSYLQFINQSHNGYLDILIQLGFVGLTFLFLFFFQFIRSDFIGLPSEFKYIFIFILIHNITESSFFRDVHMVNFFFFLVVIFSWFEIKPSVFKVKGKLSARG